MPEMTSWGESTAAPPFTPCWTTGTRVPPSTADATGAHGHTAGVYAIAFMPDSRSLLSGSEDATLRVWDVERGQCIHIMQGYAVSLYDVAWSPDGPSSSPRQGGGSRLASAGSNTLV